MGFKSEMIEKSRGLRREKLYKITLISTNKKKTPPVFDSKRQQSFEMLNDKLNKSKDIYQLT